MFEGREVGVLVDRSLDPEKNMLREDMLFRRVEARKSPELVRFWVNSECLVRGKAKNPRYGWYHEDAAERLGIRVIQRETGGGVVYHDRGNLNWSFFARASGAFHSPAKVFGEASKYVVEALGKLGVPAEFALPNRIDVDGYKVSGLAARSTPKALLVHGTLLLKADLEKLNVLCIPPPGCPPVANLERWAPRITPAQVVSKVTKALTSEGFEVRAVGSLRNRRGRG